MKSEPELSISAGRQAGGQAGRCTILFGSDSGIEPSKVIAESKIVFVVRIEKFIFIVQKNGKHHT